MAIWKLTPVDLADACWDSSSHRGIALVRAASEAKARELAEKAFGVKTRFPPGGGIKPPPWLRASHVRAERVDDPMYDPEGPPEVLRPAP
jgi:hypothetical protein